MSETIGQRVLLFLDGADIDVSETPVQYAASTAGITDTVVDEGQTLSESVTLLSALSDLSNQGLVRTETARVADTDEERNVHELTEAGRQRAARLRAELRDDSVEVRRNGRTETVRIEQFLADHPNWTLVDLLREAADGTVEMATADRREELVGRSEAMRAVEAALDAAEDGDGSRLFLVGEPGVGKTKALSAAASEAESRGFETAVTRCTEDAQEPFRPIHRLLDAKLPETDDNPLAAVDPEHAGDADAFAAARSALFSEVAASLLDAASDRPLFVGIDDLHWASAATVELLSSLVETLRDAPVVFVGTLRSVEAVTGDQVASLFDDEDADRLQLNGFDKLATRKLVERRLDTTRVPDEFVETMQSHTGGIPLFVMAVTSHLLESGEVRPEYDVYPSEFDSVPAEVSDAVSVLLEDLPEPSRRVLDAGSVVGDQIPLDLLRSVSAVDSPEFETHVDLLVDTGIWMRVDDEDYGGTVAFGSGVVRERVGDELSAERRRHLHLAAASHLSRGERGSERNASAAHHYEAAGEYADAVSHYRLAGDEARAVYANEDALEWYERAFTIAKDRDTGEDVALAVEAGKTARPLGEFEVADSYFEYARTNSGDLRLQQELYAEQSDLRTSQGRTESAAEYASSGLELGDGEPTTERAQLLSKKGWAVMQRGDLEDARDIFEREREAAAGLGDRERATALHDLGTVHYKLGETEPACDLLEDAAALWRTIGDDREMVRTQSGLGIVEWQRGNLESATDRFESALDTAHRNENRDQVSALLNNLGTMYLDSGKWDRALDRYDEAIDLNRQMNDKIGLGHCFSNESLVYTNRAAFDAAATHAEQARETWRAVPDEGHVAHMETRLGRIALRRGDVDDARAALERARELLEEGSGSVERYTANVEGLAADLHRATGKPDEAVDHAREAVAAANDSPVAGYLRLVDALVDDGQFEAAVDAAVAAVRAADESGKFTDEIRANLAVGRARRAVGDDDDEAREALEAASRLAGDVDALWFESRARYERALALADCGDEAGARDALSALRDDCEQSGIGSIAAQCRDALREL